MKSSFLIIQFEDPNVCERFQNIVNHWHIINILGLNVDEAIWNSYNELELNEISTSIMQTIMFVLMWRNMNTQVEYGGSQRFAKSMSCSAIARDVEHSHCLPQDVLDNESVFCGQKSVSLLRWKS